MPSFDIVSKVDPQLLDNALNTVKKELQNRYDFRDTKGSIELDKKSNVIQVTTENTMRLGQIEDIIISKFVKQNIDATALDFTNEEYASGPMVKKEIKVRAGIDKETGKKIVKVIKDQKLKIAEGKAFVVEGSNNAKLKVQFQWPFKGDYWIIDLAPDYSYVIISEPKREALWILARQPHMDPELYLQLVNSLKQRNFDIGKLQLNDQSCGE